MGQVIWEYAWTDFFLQNHEYIFGLVGMVVYLRWRGVAVPRAFGVH